MFVKCQALRRRGIPNWGVFGQKHLQGGGPMIDIGVHVIEMAHFVMGSPRPVAASGNTWTYLGDALQSRLMLAELGLQDVHRRGPGDRPDSL
jgi:predicted dehydrogenase